MDAPLTFNGQEAWVNTPENRVELARTSLVRKIKRELWLTEQTAAANFVLRGDWYEDATFA